jgi:hypothetical protein
MEKAAKEQFKSGPKRLPVQFTDQERIDEFEYEPRGTERSLAAYHPADDEEDYHHEKQRQLARLQASLAAKKKEALRRLEAKH